jgi:hypothetical protein
MELLCAEDQDLNPIEDWIFERPSLVKPGAFRQGGQLPSEGRFDRVIVLDSLAVNPVSATVAQAADAVLLVIETGVSKLAAARRVMDSIGRERIVGCVMVSSR